MPVTWYDGLHLRQRPRWDVDGGIWYVEQGTMKFPNEHEVAKIVPTRMYRYKPTIQSICEPLLGATISRGGKVVGVRYPTAVERQRIYREAIELIVVFKDHDDLFTLAMYRRQVTRRGGIPADQLFFNLACDAGFTKEQWLVLAQRMPDRAPVYGACMQRATLPRESLAAE